VLSSIHFPPVSDGIVFSVQTFITGNSNKCEPTECRLNEGIMRRVLEHGHEM